MHQDDAGIVGDHQPKTPLRTRRIEFRRRDQVGPDPQQDVARRLLQRLRQRRRHQLALRDRENVVVEILAQPANGGAHRRLAQMQPPARRHDAALFEDRIQRDQEIEVEAVEAHGLTSILWISWINIIDYSNSKNARDNAPRQAARQRRRHPGGNTLIKPWIFEFMQAPVAADGKSLSVSHDQPPSTRGTRSGSTPNGWISRASSSASIISASR